MIARKTTLPENIIQFCRFLRSKEFTAGAQEETSILLALSQIDFTQSRHFYLLLRAILCRTHSQLKQFDQLYHDYWKEAAKAVESKIKEQPAKKQQPALPGSAFKSVKSWLQGDKSTDTQETTTYSWQENLSARDFSSIPGDELPEMLLTIKSMAKRLAAQLNRRRQIATRMNKLDLRQVLRKNMRRGGELIELSWKERRPNRNKLLLFCDMSRSMELYSLFLIQFMFAFQQVYRRLETFAFGTSLKRMTAILKKREFAFVLQELSAMTTDWNAGTRIGDCLEQFVTAYGAKMIDRKTTIIILSDGWDSGDTITLKKSLAFMRGRAKKIVWLNPLLSYASYQPGTAGMQAALPFIDRLAPAHNVDSLRKLAKWI